MSERGFAVIVALVVTLALSAIGAGLLTMVDIERLIARNHREAVEVLEAAAAAGEAAFAEVAATPSWNDVLAGLAVSAYRDGTLSPRLLSNETLDVAAETAALQTASDARARRGLDNPRWRLFLHSPLAAMTRTSAAREYVMAWVADDVSETDNDPETDTNGVVVIRAKAVARLGVSRTVEAAFVRQDGRARLLSWREVQ
jgi:hypothetical protein